MESLPQSGRTPKSPTAVRSTASPTSKPSAAAPTPPRSRRSPAAPTPCSPAAPTLTPSSPAAPTQTPAPDVSIVEPRRPPPPTVVKKRKRSIQSSGELHGEHQETSKVVMKSSKSKKKSQATELISTNPMAVDMDNKAPSLKKKRLSKRDHMDKQPSIGSVLVDKDKQPSPASLPVEKDKQPSPASLPVEKDKQPALSKKMVRSPILNNVVVSILGKRGKNAKSVESSPSHPSLLALSPNVANPGSRKPRKLKSKIWNEVEPIYVDGMLAQGRCVHCNQIFPASKKSGTSHIGKHLEVCEEKAKIDGMVAQIRTDNAINPKWKFDQVRARRALAKLIVLHELPFSFVEYPGFRSFAKTLNPWFNVVSRTTIKEDCIASYDRHKKEIQAFFRTLSSRVSLTGDMWTSNQKLGYLCITAHFIDDSWTLQNKIIRFCLLETPHNAHNIFDMVQKSLRDWNIEEKIFSFTLDNAPVNDSMVGHLTKNLADRYLVHHRGKLLHVRCAAHVLNLVVKDGLDAMASVVNRIRDSVQYIKSSQGRKEKFDKMIAQVGLSCKNHPSLDVPTRCNSTYLMLESSLPFRAAFEALKQADKDYEFAPSASEWEMAEAICHLLGAFYTATNKISGRIYPTSHLYFYEVWNVKQVMEKEVLSENATIVAMVKEMEKKWTKYFEESFLTSCVLVIFDPRYKYEYIEFQLTLAFGGGAEIYLTKVKNAMNILFAEYASQFENIYDESDEAVDEDGEDTLDDWDKHLRLKRSHNSNELQRYLEEDLFPRRQKLDILKWWEIHSPKYPVLAAIARDILAVSASIVPTEAAFSNAGRVITDHRSSLSPSTVEVLMCLEDWLRAADRQKMETAGGDYGGDQKRAANN